MIFETDLLYTNYDLFMLWYCTNLLTSLHGLLLVDVLLLFEFIDSRYRNAYIIFTLRTLIIVKIRKLRGVKLIDFTYKMTQLLLVYKNKMFLWSYKNKFWVSIPKL